MTIIELEFDTSAARGAPLGDIASSLVSIDELLRDLATLTASDTEFREIQVAAITMRSPMRVTLSLLAIPEEAVKAFQDICRGIISGRPAAIDTSRLTPEEAERMRVHVETLKNAEVPLKAVMIKGE